MKCWLFLWCNLDVRYAVYAWLLVSILYTVLFYEYACAYVYVSPTHTHARAVHACMRVGVYMCYMHYACCRAIRGACTRGRVVYNHVMCCVIGMCAVCITVCVALCVVFIVVDVRVIRFVRALCYCVGMCWVCHFVCFLLLHAVVVCCCLRFYVVMRCVFMRIVAYYYMLLFVVMFWCALLCITVCRYALFCVAMRYAVS